MSDQAANVKMEAGWKQALIKEFDKPYFKALRRFLVEEKKAGQLIFPPGKFIFNAFNSTPFDQVKVVIIGQDPYHGHGQAHGLCFSVQPGVRIPPSLRNIYKELHDDIGFTIPAHGYLQTWAEQGVLMLNAMLTVRASQAGSHKGKGWEQFTSAAIQKINKERDGIIFLLWGKYAQEKGAIIDLQRHHVLKAAHPSPFAADKGFFGCKHFSKTNELLQQMGRDPINWQI
ncbi:MAG: uracil-DNA glycosylase [Bacteroidota bacterium]